MSSSQRPERKTPAPGDLLQVHIEKLAIGGDGVARADGFVLFVPDAAPGDTLQIRVRDVRDNHGFASIEKILTPGPGRREPPCKYAVDCGGCGWQHLTEEAQRQQKSLLLEETLKKFLPNRPLPIEPFVPSPEVLRYRNRVQPHYQSGRLGFFRRKSHDFLPVDDCLLIEEPLSALFRDGMSLPASDKPRRVELRINTQGKAEISDSGETDGFSFSQVNRFQNQNLIDTALAWAAETPADDIWDLYAGSGNFTFPMHEKFPKARMTAVELSAALVRKGRENSSSSVDFMLSDVEAYLARRIPPKNALVILDPPRAGAGRQVMKSLAASPARQLIYISCHPVSLARDLADLFAAPGGEKWRLARIRLFEMFPQTDHMETMVQLLVDSL